MLVWKVSQQLRMVLSRLRQQRVVWSDSQLLQGGRTSLMLACEGGHLDIVKHVCEVGGKELVMAPCRVSG